MWLARVSRSWSMNHSSGRAASRRVSGWATRPRAGGGLRLRLMPWRRPCAGGAVSELEQLGGRCRDAMHVGAEINEQGDSLFDTGDRAETVFVVGDLVVYREAFGGRLGIGGFERAGCQAALAPG